MLKRRRNYSQTRKKGDSIRSRQPSQKARPDPCEVKVLVTQACLTLCNPMDCSPPDSSVHGILQARMLEWVAMPSSRGSSPPQNSNLGLLYQRQILYNLSHREAQI